MWLESYESMKLIYSSEKVATSKSCTHITMITFDKNMGNLDEEIKLTVLLWNVAMLLKKWV